MAQRRGNGEGSITQRADGRWHVRVDLGRGIDGSRQRKSGYAATEAEAVLLLRRLGGRAVDGQLLATSTPTVSTFLNDWFATYRDDWRPSTQRSYRGAIDLYLVPAFGPLRLEQLSPVIVQRWLTTHKHQHGARRRIGLAHAILRSALTSAQKLQLVTINAAALVTVPKPATTRAIVPLTLEQARQLLAAAETHRLGALFSVALACGLRLGEATGLTWDDVNLETGELRVHQQLQRVAAKGQKGRLRLQPLKTEQSRRTLLLPDACLRVLRAHRTHQREERLKAGPLWREHNLVFTTLKRGLLAGNPLDGRNVLRTLHRMLKAAKLPRCRFHDLRHSAASLLLAEGVQLAEISKLLGHSQLRLTSDLYSHLQRETASKAARLMDAILTRS